MLTLLLWHLMTIMLGMSRLTGNLVQQIMHSHSQLVAQDCKCQGMGPQPGCSAEVRALACGGATDSTTARSYG